MWSLVPADILMEERSRFYDVVYFTYFLFHMSVCIQHLKRKRCKKIRLILWWFVASGVFVSSLLLCNNRDDTLLSVVVMRCQASSDSYHTNKTKCTFLFEAHTKVREECVSYDTPVENRSYISPSRKGKLHK